VPFSVNKYAHIRTYVACFRSPDGRRLQRDTDRSRQVEAIEVARAIIEKEYMPTVPIQKRVTWDEAENRLASRLETSGNRPATRGYYLKLLRLVKREADAPEDFTPLMAAAWRDRILSRPSRRKKPPSAHYVAGLLVGLCSLWQKWLIDDLKLLSENPWKDVVPPKADKLQVRYATDELIEQFYQWIGERFGDWPFPMLFLATKAYTGCRLMDLCSLASDQVVDGRLVFPADVTKGRKERRVPLPEDLFRALAAFKGPTHLWENYLPGLKAALTAKGWPVHQLNDEFAPRRLYFWVETLFADYRAHPKRPVLTTHMFRKRAFTLAWEAGIDMRKASIAYGCNVDTMMRHYVAMDEQAVTDDVFAQMRSSKWRPTQA